ncbi:patatin-like protein [Thermaurantiacus sp.]
MTKAPERELRLALVCYGGVSLVIYMHGVTKELWKLLKASVGRRDGTPAAGDTEPVWTALLEAMGRSLDLRVICDVIAGASAGGINGIILGAAIVEGLDLEPLSDMWLEKADVEALLDPDARPASRLVGFYKEPVAWYAQRKSETLASLRDDPVAREVAGKLGRFVRARWFKPPFSGPGFTAMLDEAIARMQAGPRGPALVPPAHSFDLFVTVTDYWGTTTKLPIHSPPLVSETEHRRILSFRSRATTGIDAARRRAAAASPRALGSRPSLVFAARATASFPGAFPAASVKEIDARNAETGTAWPDRDRFLATQLAGDRSPEDMLLIDGSVLANAPFGPAIEAIRVKPAYREVDRRFVYIDPKPGIQLLDRAAGRNRPPGFLTAILRALAQIPREQPIRDNLEEIAALSDDVRRVRAVVEGMTPAVDAAIARAVGARFFLLPLTPQRIARAGVQIQAQAAREAGFAFAAYARLRLETVLEEAARLIAGAAGGDATLARQLLPALRAAAEARGVFDYGEAPGRAATQSATGRFLLALDSAYRLRRQRFLLRRLNAQIAALKTGPGRAAAEELKATLHLIAGPYVENRQADRLRARAGPAVGALAASPADLERAGAALDALGEALDCRALDKAADRALLAALDQPGLPRGLRRLVVRDWLGFPFFDIALLPLLGGDRLEGLEDIKVDRISPDDCASFGRGGAAQILKGWQLNAFGAFFSRAWRENDYLWGRLNAAERLVDILASTLPPEAALDTRRWKAQLFVAILDSERGRLGRIGALIETLKGEVAAWANI